MEPEPAYKNLDRSFLSVFMNAMLKRPMIVVLIFMAITIVFGWRIPHLSFRTSVYDMVIKSLPETSRYNTFKEVFGSDEIIRLVIKTENIFTP